ncbi:serine hydrolase [Evansella sp. AB-P1]|uniref:serine hydrolase domain-containing protein n=1 Tax=Evansella sp. AB-P1 TaxID=3037653 RepID=UPI00241CB45C|nr:serine hydrolase domain-containing protein [Evansella sp. AB-P1]MDG5789694.1 serine hydrolase [Evansella sp. AB-P1]
METIQWSQFENYLLNKMNNEHICGVSVAVSQHGEVIYQKGFGYKNITTEEPITPNTIFGIASITKSFTALAIMELEDKGLINLDDPVIKHLPEWSIRGVRDMEQFKIYHLLSHTTGLAPMERREDLNKLKEHVTYFDSKQPEFLGKPGKFFSYCNDTFILLGAIIERITGKLFRRHITEMILNPLNMYRSTMSLEEVAKYEDVSTPYDYNGSTNKLEEQPWPRLGNYEVGGGVRSTALDLLKYGQFYLDAGKRNREQWISSNVLKQMWINPFEITEGSYYGYAFKVTKQYSNMTLVEHGGGQPGVSSNFGFIPEKNLVVAVLCNVSNIAADDIWLRAVNTALHIPFEQKRITYPEKNLSIDQLANVVGKYSCEEGSSVKIFIENNRPMLNMNGEIFELKGASANKLVIIKTERPIQFYFKGEGGRAWALLLGARMLIRREEESS